MENKVRKTKMREKKQRWRGVRDKAIESVWSFGITNNNTNNIIYNNSDYNNNNNNINDNISY